MCSCGKPRDETMAADAEGTYIAEPYVCFACEAKSRAQRRFEDDETAPRDGLYFAVSR